MRSGNVDKRTTRAPAQAAEAGRRRYSPRDAGVSDAVALRRHADAAARLLRSIAHRQRLQVLCLLADDELSVGQINERMRMSQSALSQQLARMRADGLVTTRREAQTIFYRIASGPARVLIAALHGIYCAAPAAGSGKQAARG